MNPLRSEPALTAGAVMAVVYILVAFGLPLSPEQQEVLKANLPVVLPMIGILVGVIRQMVFAPDTVEEMEAQSFNDGWDSGVREMVAVNSGTPVVPATGPPAHENLSHFNFR
jgi:hypothetical protein